MIYTSSDFQGYYSGCFGVVTKNYKRLKKGQVVIVEQSRSENGSDREFEIYVKTESGTTRVPSSDFFYVIEMGIPLLGYFYTKENSVVYLSNKQSRSYKKGLNSQKVVAFYPQYKELELLGKSDDCDYSLWSLFDRKYVSINDVDKALEIRYAVILHRNFAVIKKGDKEHPVLYYKRSPVAYYIDGELQPFEESSSYIISKLYIELESLTEDEVEKL